jgi:hypothetical protein
VVDDEEQAARPLRAEVEGGDAEDRPPLQAQAGLKLLRRGLDRCRRCRLGEGREVEVGAGRRTLAGCAVECRPTVRPALEAEAQSVMMLAQAPHRAGHPRRVHGRAGAQQDRLVVVMGVRQLLREEIELDRRQGRPSGDRALLRRRGRRAAGHRRELGDRLVLEHLAGRQAQPHPGSPGDDLDAQDRVATQVEDVVVHAHAPHAEDLLPDLGEPALHRVARRHELAPLALEIGSRQGCAVHLAVRCQRQRAEDDERGRHHVLRQPFAQPGAPRRRIGALLRRDHPGRQRPSSRAGGGHRERGLADSGVLRQHRLDLSELDAEAADLHLVVGASEEVQAAVVQPAGDVAGSVEAVTRRAEGVREEALGGQVGPAAVAARETRPADVKLAGHPGRHRLELAIEQIGRHVVHRSADRRRPLSDAGNAGVQGIDGARRRHDCVLRRPVVIDQAEAQRPGGSAVQPVTAGEQEAQHLATDLSCLGEHGLG